MAKSNIISGAKLAVFINGKRFATCTEISWNSETPREALHTVDAMEPWELAPTLTRTTGTMSLVRQTADGGAEGVGMVAPISEVSKERYFSLELKEHATDITVFQALRCAVTSQNWRAISKGLLTGTLSFQAIEWANEVQLFRP